MKGMVDDLRALGETITYHHLILNLLHGLNKRFDHMKIFSKQSQPFPSYNPWTSTISMWPGIGPPPQQLAHPPQHALLTTPVYYGVPGGPSFTPLLAPPPHQ
jgi:hypothetical protein